MAKKLRKKLFVQSLRVKKCKKKNDYRYIVLQMLREGDCTDKRFDNRDEYTPYIKRVRVVNTVEYVVQ